MDLEEIGINADNWVDSAQDRDYWRALVNAASNLGIGQLDKEGGTGILVAKVRKWATAVTQHTKELCLLEWVFESSKQK